MSKFEIIFYEKEDGTMPAQDFLDSLDDKMRAKMILIKGAVFKTP